jgi:hypothetical protein
MAIRDTLEGYSYYPGNKDRHESDTSTKRQRVNSRGDQMIHSLALRACM